MNKFLITALLLFFSLTSYKCKDDSVDKNEEHQGDCEKGGVPGWVSKQINEFQSNEIKAEIIQYQYKGQYVFLINDCRDCADAMTVVYNCKQEELCKFGGIAGFNTCPDFGQNASEEKLIWRN